MVSAILLGGIVAALTACGPKTFFAAPPMKLDDGIHVEVTEAFTRGDRIFVEAWVTNDNKKKTVRVNPNGFAVKLPTGELVSKRNFARDGKVHILGPGQDKRIDVDFRQEGYDLSGLEDAVTKRFEEWLVGREGRRKRATETREELFIKFSDEVFGIKDPK